MRAPKVHVESPMFSNNMLCGRRRKDIKGYVWTEYFRVTCKRCLAALNATRRRKGDSAIQG